MKLASLAAFVAATVATPAFAGDVTVSVSGVQPNSGQVWAVLQRKAQFLKAQGAYSQKAPATSDTVQVVFHNVAPGDYAAAAIQDTDQNGSVAVNKTGATEPWGVSGPTPPQLLLVTRTPIIVAYSSARVASKLVP